MVATAARRHYQLQFIIRSLPFDLTYLITHLHVCLNLTLNLSPLHPRWNVKTMSDNRTAESPSPIAHDHQLLHSLSQLFHRNTHTSNLDDERIVLLDR